MLSLIQVLFTCALASTQPTTQPDPRLAALLNKMDAVATGFKGMSASVTQVNHTAAINSDDKETGKVFIRRNRPGDRPVILKEVEFPDQKTVSIHERTVEIYLPKAKTVQEYNISEFANLVDQAFLIGIAPSGKELQKNYDLSLGEEATISGQKAVRLDLAPRSAKLKEQFNKAALWITEGGYAIQQKLFTPSGDYYLVTYSELKLNPIPALTDQDVKLKLPPGVRREFPQKP